MGANVSDIRNIWLGQGFPLDVGIAREGFLWMLCYCRVHSSGWFSLAGIYQDNIVCCRCVSFGIVCFNLDKDRNP